MEINFKSGSGEKKKLEEQKNQTDLENNLRSELKKLSKRISSIEQNFENVDKEMTKRDIDWSGSMDKDKKNMESFKKTLQSLDKKINDDINTMQNIISQFKNSVKSNEFNKTNAKIDNIKNESLITKNRFKKLIIEEIDKRL